jgi:uncharacterized membrane protein YecN with MAPEG domain
MVLQTTLCLAAAAAIINLWLSMRIGQLRMKGRILYGDGGDEMLIRRMRAHANFVENTPLVLILIGMIEIAGKGGTWLAIVGAIYMLARLGHAIGMDGGAAHRLRSLGALITMLTLVGLAVMALLVALGRF